MTVLLEIMVLPLEEVRQRRHYPLKGIPLDSSLPLLTAMRLLWSFQAQLIFESAQQQWQHDFLLLLMQRSMLHFRLDPHQPQDQA